MNNADGTLRDRPGRFAVFQCCSILLLLAVMVGPAQGADYRRVPEHSISGHNIKTLRNVTVHDCEVACDGRSDCLTFDYTRKGKTCYLQNTTEGARPSSAYDHYVKPGGGGSTPAGRYRRIAEHSIPGKNIKTLRNVTVRDCEAACDGRNDCVTFDYTRKGMSCYLQNTGAGVKRSADYDHYVKPGGDIPAPAGRYRRVPEHAIPGHNIKSLRNVTVRDCEIACDGRNDCVTFDYTRKANRCVLQDTTQGARPSSAYDHYVKPGAR